MTKLQVLEKVIQALSKQPTLVLGIVVCTSATGLIASASYHNLPPLNPPARPSKEATQEEINHYNREVDNYNQQLRWHSLLKVGHIIAVAFVFAGGVFLVYQISEGTIKLHQITEEKEKAIRAMEIAFEEKYAQSVTKTRTLIKKTFLDAANCGSPSFVLLENDTDAPVKVYTQHRLGVAGGSFSERTHEIERFHCQVVGGNPFSWGLGQGVSVRVGDSPSKFLTHGDIAKISQLSKKP
jgi:hypothetical protein